MNKIDIRQRNGVTILCLHSKKKQQINQIELEALKKRTVDALLPATAHTEGKNFILVYNITGYLPLRDYLRKPIDKRQFGLIVRQFINILQSMREHGYNAQNLLLDLQHVMIHSTSETIAFIYAPIQYFDNQTPVKTLFLDIAHKAAFSQLESTDYVRDYISIIQRGVNFSVFELDEYLERLNNTSVSPYQTKLEEFDTASTASTETSFKEAVYDGLGTGLQYEHDRPVQTPYLLRDVTGEKIPITLASFRLGRDMARADYAVSGNKAISGCHAIITIEGTRFFITDQNSLNHTYVNGRELTPGEQTEIYPGTQIDIADEGFTLCL